MAPKKRLVLVVLSVCLLVYVYFLCMSLDRPLSWSMLPINDIYGFTQVINSDSRDSAVTPTNTAGQTQSSTSRSGEGPHEVRNSTEGHTVKPPQAPRSTESPFIGDTYMSEDLPPQTDCKKSIRGLVSKTEFGDRFLEHIPVLQWAKHATREQYERLKEYSGTHGWGRIDFDTLVETLSVLNTSANWQMFDDWKTRSNKSECIRCAVVGSGGILNNSKKGKEIDGHDYIFRTNGAVTEGFEEDVGTRTTHYTFSTNTLMNSIVAYRSHGFRGPPVSEETRYVFLPDHDRDYLLMKAAAEQIPVDRGIDKGKDPLRYFGKDVSVKKLKMYHPDFARYIRNRFLQSRLLKSRYKNIYRTSTGAAMLLAALHSCDQVSAYGFMTPDYLNYSNHYYDKHYVKVRFYANHDFGLERDLWQQLHQAGLIQLYMRN